ncbi:MAG: hypothetical protein Q8Q73_13220 [Stagnimonas sp.]|nr:hypothetical protein [Stagnimonas sp.]
MSRSLGYSNEDIDAAIRKERRETRFLIAASELPAVMRNQALLFSKTADDRVTIPQYLADQVNKIVDAISKDRKAPWSQQPSVTVIFDRARTTFAPDLLANPNGWFKAVMDVGMREIYISPTFIRGGMLACAGYRGRGYTPSQQQYSPILGSPYNPEAFVYLKNSIEQYENGQAKRRAIIKLISEYTKMADAFDSCLVEEFAFLIGHELTHTLPKGKAEDIADCVGYSVAKQYGAKNITLSGGITVQGVFGTFVFDAAASTEHESAGLSEIALDQISCRAEALDQSSAGIPADFEDAITYCLNRTPAC